MERAKRPLGATFYASTVVISLFVLWGAISPASLQHIAGDALEWMITNFGWFYMLVTAFFILFVFVLAISPFGKLKLGKDEDKPEFSWFSWFGMLFAAGLGVGFVFFGVAEPILYYNDPPVGIEPGTRAAALAALRYGAYHWAFHPWAIFAIVGLTLAYVPFRKGRPALVSSALYPFLGYKTDGAIGKTVDILAVLATCTGVATTFGLSAMQITGGLSFLTDIPNTTTVQLTVIAIVTVLFMISTASGLDKGIKLLSNTNIFIAAILLLFILVFGPTLFIAENFVTTLGGYISNLIPMSLTLTPFSESDWLGRNTIFFWAWHISWAPFMGLFIARISKGRTVRQFIAGVLLVPATIAVLWFTVFGGTGLNIEINGPGGLSEIINENVELALFAMLEHLPFSVITSFIGIILIFIFFITSADSATYVLSSMTSKGSLNPSMRVKIIWGVLIAGTASVLLLSGGGGLEALQTASPGAALPFSIVMLVMIAAILIMVSRDWKLHKRVQRKERDLKVKEDFRDEFLDEVKDGVYDDMKDNVYDEVFGDVKDEVYDNVKEEVYDEMKGEVLQDFKEEIYEELKQEMKEEIFEELDSNSDSDHDPNKNE